LIAQAADVVGRSFTAGDPSAARVVAEAAADLVALLRRGLARLDTPPPHPVVLRGGLLSDASPLLRVFKDKAADVGMDIDYRIPRRTPVGAALAIAKEASNEIVTASFLERIDELNAD
jgi:N-acetylglucosamine kinase-like BadF-type ATPase